MSDTFTRKLPLLILAVLFCLSDYLFAGVKPPGVDHPKPGKDHTGLKEKRFAAIAPPVISYSGPQTYTQGTAIAPLVPTSTGVAASAYSGTSVPIGGPSFNAPAGIAVDAAGNIYVADYGNSLLKKIPAGGGAPVTINAGFTRPYGVAVDRAGNVYVSDIGTSKVSMLPVGGGAPVILGINLPDASIAVDAAGNVYVCQEGSNTIKEIPAGGGIPVVIGSGGLSNPTGIAVDAAGNVYVADFGSTDVVEIPANGGPETTITGFSKPAGVAVDGAGNLFVTDYGAFTVQEVPAGTTTPVPVGPGGFQVFGVAVDGADNVYFTINFNVANPIQEFSPVGGYSISPFLPAGLNFDSNTGIISGTPTVSSPAITYTITAYNASGSASATVNIKVNPEPVPAISYTSPQTYNTGTAITPLAPTSNRVAAAGYSTGATNLGSGFVFPAGVAVDAAGNVYVADNENNAVKKIPAGGGTPITLASGLSEPAGVAVDRSGNVYFSNYTGNTVMEIPAGGGAPVSLGSGFSAPAGLAVDAAGNVYVADVGNNAVKKIPAGGGTPVIIGSGFNFPFGVALDAAGNVYVADVGNNAVKKIPAGGGAPVVIGSGFSSPYGVAVDASGNIYVADEGNGAVKQLPAGGGAPVIIGPPGINFSAPVSVAVDGAGNVYVGDENNSVIKEISPVGGYYINTALPAGLNFSNTTGIINGTPTAGSPSTNYTITAYNPGGGGKATVNITVHQLGVPSTQASDVLFTNTNSTSTTVSWTNGNGSARAVFIFAGSTGTPAPVNNTTYTANTVYATGTQIGTTGWYCVYNGSGSTVNVTGLTASTSYRVMVVEYNGAVGSESYLAATATGNPANITTSSPPAPLIATTGSLSGLTTTYGIASATGTFKVSGTNMGQGILVTPPAGYEVSTSPTTGFGSTVTIGAAGTITSTSVYIRLAATTAAGNYPAGNVVLSSTGATDVNVAIPAGTVNKAALTVTATGVNKVYDNTTAATVTLADNPVNGDVITTAYTSAAFNDKNVGIAKTVNVTGISISGGASANYTANTTANTTANITIAAATVTAQTDTKVYTATTASAVIPVVTGLIGTDAVSAKPIQIFDTPNVGNAKTLTPSGLTINDGNNGNNYSITYVPNTTGVITAATLTYTATPVSRNFGVANPALTGTLTGFVGSDTQGSATTGALSFTTTATVNSPPGNYNITGTGLSATNYVFVQAPVNSTALTISPTAANDAALANLTISSGTLSPVFASGTKSYTDAVDNDISTVTLTPTAAGAGATITINNTAVNSGAPSGDIALNEGDNTITIVVTAADGVTQETYTVIVTRARALQGTVVANNLITPNGDGKNDTWVVSNIQSYPNNMVTIFDRTGRTVYTKKGYNNDWGGTYQGVLLSQGTYYYVIDLGPGLNKIKGYITLLRD